jgi:hypothetical protein
VINWLLVASSEWQLGSNLRQDLPLVILGSIVAAIGVAALVVHLSRGQSRERVLLWFGLFASPYGLRLLTNTSQFRWRSVNPFGFGVSSVDSLSCHYRSSLAALRGFLWDGVHQSAG